MKKLFFVLLFFILASSLFGQWKYDNFAGVSPKVRESIIELRTRSLLGAKDDIWFVDANDGLDTNGGESWDKAFATIAKALTAADSFDVILLAPGTYQDEELTITTTHTGLKMIGPGFDNQHNALVYVTDSSNHALTINAHKVLIDGIGFTVNKDTKDAIRISTTASYHKTMIRNCRFDGYGNGEYAIHTGSTYDSPDLVIENCVFRSWQTAAIYSNATRAIIRNNTFHVVASTAGIDHIPTGANRPDTFIYDNLFLGSNDGDTGIKISNTPSAGALAIVKNYLCGCATAITQTDNGEFNSANNYESSKAGGTIIDTDSD